MKRFTPLLPYLLPLGLLLAAGGDAQAWLGTPIVVVRHDWTMQVGSWRFGVVESEWGRGDQGRRRWVVTEVYCGSWWRTLNGWTAPGVASAAGVFAAVAMVASGVLIRRRQ